MSQSKSGSGYRVGKINSVHNRFKCNSCKLVLRDPVQAEACGHRYCRDCVPADGIDCPACKQEGDDDISHVMPSTVRPDAAIQREIQRTKFRCPWEPCSTELKLVPDLVRHAEQDCKHRKVVCEACGQELPVGKKDQHDKSQCPKRPVECDKCKEFVAWDELDKHRNTVCPGSTQQCQSCLARVPDSPEARLHHALTECTVGWANGQPCPFGCGGGGPLADAAKHRAECLVGHIDLSAAREASGEGATGGSQAEALVEQSPSEPESLLVQLDSQLSMAETTISVINYGLPHSPANTGDLVGQNKFFDRIIASGRVMGELEREHLTIAGKLKDSDSKMKPLMEQKQIEYEELSRASDKYSELLRAMAMKEVRICDLERSIALQELGSQDGTLFWKIAFFRERLNGTDFEPVVVSPILYTDKFGYKLVAVAYLNGHDTGRDSHLSLYARILKGPYDGSLPWPFKFKVTFTLLDQTSSSGQGLKQEYLPGNSSQFQRPSQPMGQPFGFDKFAPKDELESKGYLKDDALFVKLQVAKPPLESQGF